ncbi:MAG TPA: cysteine--tRNA ligase [Candidatus Polarisedimenticolia bacterium]|nr:cysteine--tRNA ligase [Candidatus Polarisedimenticolia bacterium]
MSLRVYDTRARKKLDFEPVRPGHAGMYVCGMTVQDKPHVGHMRYAVAGDVIRRYLESKGLEVTYVTNFTDIDDRIIDRANKEGIPFQKVSERNMKAFITYADLLNIKRATHYPRATEHIPEILTLIQRLIDSGHAYAAGQDVYFDVRSYPKYGDLSNRNVDDLRQGVRIEIGESKRDPLDFTLWKGAKPGEPSWPSPWGPGRPGWHIECSAMAMKYLGETFDFHGGGQDLVFPHHENEIAQSEAATGKTFARYWVENGLVLLRGAKMSKSDQHFFLVEDIAKKVEPEVIRFYLQSTHYRSPIEWNEERLREAGIAYARLRAALATGEKAGGTGSENGNADAKPKGLRADALKTAKLFEEAMEDDFNSAKAQGHLFDLAKAINRVAESDGSSEDRAALAEATQTLRRLGETLGLFWEGKPREEEVPDAIQSLVTQRDEARLQKQWKRADELRDQILALGYVLEDQKGGTRARRKL